MKLAVATCIAIALCIGSLAVRHAAARDAAGKAARAAAAPAARAAKVPPRTPADKRALAGIDKRLHRKLRRLAARR